MTPQYSDKLIELVCIISPVVGNNKIRLTNSRDTPKLMVKPGRTRLWRKRPLLKITE